MAEKYDIASSVENQCSDNGDQSQQEIPISDRIYQQQQLTNQLHQMDSHSISIERQMEIPAAKV